MRGLAGLLPLRHAALLLPVAFGLDFTTTTTTTTIMITMIEQ